jgi:TRAP-type C4-dicarboxylate transport system permease small subunit
MKFALLLSNLLKKVAGACLLGMMLLTCADVIGSSFGSPILGSEELVGLMAALLLACALPATEVEKGHIGVDLLVMKLPERVQRANRMILQVVEIGLFSLIAWQCFLYASKLRAIGQVSPTLKFPTYYLIYGVAFSFVVLAVVIFAELLVALRQGKGESADV